MEPRSTAFLSLRFRSIVAGQDAGQEGRIEGWHYVENGMQMLKGPLGSHLNYLRYIALPNCVEYFEEVKKQAEQRATGLRPAYERLRRFLNAVDSLNNVVDYFFHEHKAHRAWTDEQLGAIKGAIRTTHPVLAEIAELANAFKHCVTRDARKANAADLQEPRLLVQVSLPQESVSVTLGFDSIEGQDILGTAWRFWLAYENNPDVDLLLHPPGAVTSSAGPGGQ